MDVKETNEVIRRLKERRAKLKLSYQELADKTGISKSTLQRYETGFIKNLSVDKLELLANALDTSPEYLMGWKKAPVDAYLEFKSIKTIADALKYMFKQPYSTLPSGYDTLNMTDDELDEFADDCLKYIDLVSYKYKNK
ncbi:MAG: helix-turn-helix transcriptional regulator [Clostridiaceae bacterium]